MEIILGIAILALVAYVFTRKKGVVEANAEEAPYKVETPAGTEAVMATTEQRYVGENEQGAVYETVVVVPDAVAPAMTPIPLVVEAPVAPAKKPRTKKPAAPKAPAKPRAPKAPKAK